MNAHRLLGRLPPHTLVALSFHLRRDSEYLVFQDQRLTRRQVWTAVRDLAAGLQTLGVQKGERIAVLLPPCPQAVYPIFLPALLGSVNVPLNPLLRPDELRRILADCAAGIVLTTGRGYGQDYPAMLAAMRQDLPALRHVVVCGAAGKTLDRRAGQIDWNAVAAPSCRLRRVPLGPDDLALISYTSGTSGQAKGVAHLRARTLGLLTPAVGPQLADSPLRCLLVPFAPFHFAGIMGLVTTLLAGGRAVLLDRFDPRRMLALIQSERVTQVAAAPTMYRWLLQTPGQERYDLSAVRRVTFSTEPCPPELAEALYTRFRCSLQNIYGTAESMVISWTGPEDPWEAAATTVGRPVPGAQVRIVDSAGRPAPAGQRGEIVVRTAQMMSGYYRDPELTAQVLDDAGWFYTGDVGYLDADGRLRVVDRKKDLILRGGQNVYPAEVETCLQRHPAIRQAGVVGVPSAVAGEAVWAYVELVPGQSVSAGEVLGLCRERLAPFKVPEQVRFLARLPVTATGKVEKYRLRELARAETRTGESV